MEVTPPFDELHFVEQNELKAGVLRHAASGDQRVTVHRGDGIAITERLLERVKFRDYRRALCLLDPYDLSVPWSLVKRIGEMQSVEIFYNFMIMDANRNVLWNDPSRVPAERLTKMDLVWGDRSWQDACYERVPDLFGETRRKLPNEAIAEAFRKRLQSDAGFKFAPAPIAMKNSMNAAVYYLHFASPNETGARIVEEIFSKYRR
jgi:three-Cys-motif partner protein